MARYSPEVVFDALAARPDGAAVLGLRGARIAVVGGFVRDSLIGREPREIDLVIEGDVSSVAAKLGGRQTPHPAFLACHVARDGWTIELTQARRERYARPGALPIVQPASIEEDLARRDFSVNTIAVTLADRRLIAPAGALEDLSNGVLRVLHEDSFVDDPTRVMRLARYRARLGFGVEPLTARLAELARLDTVSGARIGAELRLIAGDDQSLAALAQLRGKLPVALDLELAARALALAPSDADRQLVVLASILRDASEDWLESLELTARERNAIGFAARGERLAAEVGAAQTPGELAELLSPVPAEAAAVLGALGPAAATRSWFEALRHVRLEISGDDLLAAGIPAGPQVGERLARTLRRKRDGLLVAGRQAELESALEALP
ncbi:MAG: hypothetical protein ABSC56_00065 [Solirubrobacteraceae bacterium]|jgi:tRNA nucleotidyltransferase (CCA-adding enzyme)